MTNTKKAAEKEVDKYIKALPEWSKQVCVKLRDIILKADPSIKEEWKWGPHYSSNGMVCGYGAFQKHVKLTFFNGSAMKDPKCLFNHCVDNEFSRSIKYTDSNEIDERALTAYVRVSVVVNKKGFKREVRDKVIEVPEDLSKSLAKNREANSFFNGLSYGYKKEFVELVTSARQEQTRLKRIAKVVAYCADGKRLNDKYR